MGDILPWIVAILVIVGMSALGALAIGKLDEWECEQIYNVYDCEQDNTWYPVYGEEIPEEELMP